MERNVTVPSAGRAAIRLLAGIAVAVMSSGMTAAAADAPGMADEAPSINDRRPHNPLLPLDVYVPDVEARVYDGRVYLYGSLDIYGQSWCSTQYRVFSASVDDLGTWTDHGVSFQSCPARDDPRDDVPWDDGKLYAPDVIRIGDLYYLAFCLARKGGGIGLATSPRPEGPFKDAVEVVYENGKPLEDIDPSLFVDDDGQPYLYWHGCGVKLKKAEDGRWTKIDQASLRRGIVTRKEHGFGEGMSMRKIGDTYFLAYAGGKRSPGHCIAYSVSKDPLKDFKYAGAFVWNPDGNCHGSICKIKDQWYVFYHRQANKSSASRRVCVEPIVQGQDGLFKEVEMTSQGMGPPLDAYERIAASYVCQITGDAASFALGDTRETPYKPGGARTVQWMEPSGGKARLVHGIAKSRNGDLAAFKYVEFGSGVSKAQAFSARVRSKMDCEIRLRVDKPDGELVGVLAVKKNDGTAWETRSAVLNRPVTGKRALYFEFSGPAGSELCDVESFRFIK